MTSIRNSDQNLLFTKKYLFFADDDAFVEVVRLFLSYLLYKQTKNRHETGSNLSLGTRLTVLSKRLGRKRCCDATPDRCLGGVPSHYLRFAL